jgi:hypothetical protein
MSVPDEIAKLAELHRAKQNEYGETEVYAGEVLAGLFPSGLNISTRIGFARLALFLHCVNKILRYANNFEAGGHSDSLLDLALYAMMLREIDARPPDRLRDDKPAVESNGQRRSPT